jgi:hypothetical protein
MMVFNTNEPSAAHTTGGIMHNEERTTDNETDTEGHAVKPRGIEPAGEESDDTAGHRFVPPEERPLVGSTPEARTVDGDDDPDDTEGHRYLARNVGASFDEDPVEAEQDASSGESGDTPSSADDPDGPEDTDGHRLYNRNVGVVFG